MARHLLCALGLLLSLGHLLPTAAADPTAPPAEEWVSVTPTGWSFALSLPPVGAGTYELREPSEGDGALDSSDLRWQTSSAFPGGEVAHLTAGKFIVPEVPADTEPWAFYDGLLREFIGQNPLSDISGTAAVKTIAARDWRLYEISHAVEYDEYWDETYYDYEYVYLTEDGGVLRYVSFMSYGAPGTQQQQWRERVLGAAPTISPQAREL